jgi:hypothetical protein
MVHPVIIFKIRTHFVTDFLIPTKLSDFSTEEQTIRELSPEWRTPGMSSMRRMMSHGWVL